MPMMRTPFSLWLKALAGGMAAGLLAGGLALAQTAQKPFVRDDLAASGAQIEERLKREVSVPAGAVSATLLRAAEAALAKDDGRAALPLANQAVIAQPSNAAAWRVMARAAMKITPRDWRERYDMQERAVAAAYIAYTRSSGKPQEARSLALLGDVFQWREMWRPALTAYRIALETEDNAETRKDYEALRAEKGFRLSENTVDSDSANPRACFRFTESLARGRVDFAPFVAITGKGDFAVVAEDNQLCVDGLRHGERYAVVLRQGIPSAIPGESLLKTADYEIYVRDRAPSVRASGKTYVLPRTGQQGIPVVSVNTATVGVRVLRVGDRNLVNTVRTSDFLDQMDSYQIERIVKESGQQVWQGTMAVKTELNKDIATAFPVLEATGELKPGIYLMAVKPGEFSAAQARQGEEGEDMPSYDRLSTQWFVVSDIGITAFSGPEGVHVLARSLADAGPMGDVEVRLIARNNEVLGTAKTDRSGHAKFDAALVRGSGGNAPGIVTAQLKDDYGFLDLQQTAFDLTDRGVAGRIAPSGLDAYVFAERGVYRSGETVHLTALLRDARGNAVTGMPLTLIIKRPDGMDYRRVAVADQGAGGRAHSLPLLGGAPVGTWRVAVHADPKSAPIGQTTFLVEDYVPERLELTLEPKAKAVVSGQNAEIDVNVRYLYGAPGDDLPVSGVVKVRKAAGGTAIPGLQGYSVGLSEGNVEATSTEIEGGTTTDAKGHASLAIPLQEPETTLPLEAEISITASEQGGRGVSRLVVLPILPRGVVVGVKPLFEADSLGDGDTAKFGVVMATGEGKRLARAGVKWQLSRVIRNYQWYFREGRWAYEAIKTSRRVADGEVAVSETAVAEIAAKVGWGNYRLEVRGGGADDALTTHDFTIGYVAEAKADTPDVLDVSLDKKSYADGETMQVRLSPRFAGKATLAVVSDRVAHLETVDLPAGGATVSLKASAQWGSGAYLVVLAHRPLDVAALRMPGRAIGLTWFSVGREARKLALDLGAPAMVRPRGELALPVKIANLKPGEEAFVTVAAVDIGILNLTRYKSPDATEYFFGQRLLSAELRDLYGYLIDGMQGTRGAIRSGGDSVADSKGERPTQEPLARYSGVVKVGPDGTARIAFELPAFNGSVRVMGVAWSKDRTGEASSDVIVRDPIVVQATTPRFLAIGDRSQFHIEINNVEGETGQYALDIDVKGPVTATLDPALRSLRLEKGRKAQVTVPVVAAGLGVAEMAVTLNGGGHSLGQTLRIKVQPSAPNLVNRMVRQLAPGQTLSVTNDLLADFVPDSGAVSVTASPFGALDVPALLAALDRYPYGCTEQTVSRAMPLLYVNQLASMERLALDDKAETRIQAAIDRVLSRQVSNGGFGLWGAESTSDLWLDSFVTDFLTRAREANHPVPPLAFTMALDRLRNQVTNTNEVSKGDAPDIAYALYVLARNGRPVIGDLRYLTDNKLATFDTPLSRAHLGAALALLGDRTRAKSALDSAVNLLATQRDDGLFRGDFGSKLRDAAGLLSLLAEAQAEPAQLMRVANEVDAARTGRRYTSTQEQTWMVLAAQALAREAASFTLTVDGATHRGALYRTLPQAMLDKAPLTLRNDSQAPARVVLSVSGTPTAPEPAIDQGYRLERVIYTLDGKEVEPTKLRQNERYLVAIKVHEKATRDAKLLVVDPLPSGLEIENPKLGGESTSDFNFYGEKLAAAHVEARDDRFVAAFDRNKGQKASFAVAYIVRAVTPGRYVHPAVLAEDMYRPEVFGRNAFGIVEIAPAQGAGQR